MIYFLKLNYIEYTLITHINIKEHLVIMYIISSMFYIKLYILERIAASQYTCEPLQFPIPTFRNACSLKFSSSEMQFPSLE